MEAAATALTPIPELLPPARPPRRLRRWRYAVIAAALAALASAAIPLSSRWQDASATPRYTTAAAIRGDIRIEVTASGTLSPRVQVQVGSQVSGRIAELHADYNAAVEKGQVIARLDPRLFQTEVDQARARLRAARANLTRARAVAENAGLQQKRVEELGKLGMVPGAEVDTTRADEKSASSQVETARADVTLAEAALEQAQLNLTYTTITSPIDGVVVSRSVDVGQTVAASLSAPILFVIAEDLKKMQLHTSVAESDVGRLAPGVAVEFTVDAYPNQTFRGQVKEVRFEATTVSSVVTYDAVVLVDNPELKLRPGMTANATFLVEEKRDVLTVPNRALRYRPTGAAPREPERRERRSTRRVYVLRNGAPTPISIQPGLSDGTSTEVAAGELEAGDQLILGDGDGETSPSETRGQRPGRAAGGSRARAGGPPRMF